MERRPLGGTGPELSVLGLGVLMTGADTVAQEIEPDVLARAIRTGLDAGMNWIDTAELYATGLYEKLVGRAVAARREDVFIVTKVAPAGAGAGMRPEEIRRAIRESLGRLGTDCLDLYLLHWFDPRVPLEESWGAMRELVVDGLVRFVGVSNFGRELIERCRAIGPVDAVQNQLSLLHRHDRPGLLDWLRELGIGYLAYGSLAFGLLSSAVTDTTRFDGSDWRSGRQLRFEENYYAELFAPGRIERSLALVHDVESVAGELGMPVSVLALRWVLEQPGVTALVAGSLNPRHIRMNALAGHLSLDASALARVEALLAEHLRAEEATAP